LDQFVDQADMSACIQEFLEDLPDSYRAAILLHDLHGLSDTETARILHSTRGAVKIRLHRARTRLKAALQSGCELFRDERGVLVCGRKPLAR
jgi:RNA polymerase sigma-70 factor (ECF subfamily)